MWKINVDTNIPEIFGFRRSAKENYPKSQESQKGRRRRKRVRVLLRGECTICAGVGRVGAAAVLKPMHAAVFAAPRRVYVFVGVRVCVSMCLRALLSELQCCVIFAVCMRSVYVCCVLSVPECTYAYLTR